MRIVLVRDGRNDGWVRGADEFRVVQLPHGEDDLYMEEDKRRLKFRLIFLIFYYFWCKSVVILYIFYDKNQNFTIYSEFFFLHKYNLHFLISFFPC